MTIINATSIHPLLTFSSFQVNMTFSPLRKEHRQQPLTDWPKTPFSSKTSTMGVVMASDWGNTISYEFNLSPFGDQSSNILEDIPSVFDTPSRFQSSTTNFHSSQNTSARTSISPNLSLKENDNLFNTDEKKNFIFHREGEGLFNSFSSLDTSRGTSLNPSPSPSSEEDGMGYISLKSPKYSRGNEDHIQRHSQNDRVRLDQRRNAIVDPLNLTQTTIIPTVMIRTGGLARDEETSNMLPSILSRRPSPDEDRPLILSRKQDFLHESRTPATLSKTESIPGPSSHDLNVHSVFDFPQNSNHLTFSTTKLEKDGWISFWPPNEEKKGKSRRGKGKTSMFLKSDMPYHFGNRLHKNHDLDRKNFTEKNETHQIKIEESQLQCEMIRGQSCESNSRQFIEIKTQFQTIPEHCDPARFSDNGRCLIACEACKRRKMRCTNEYPTCSNCQRRNSTCQYAQKVGTRGKSKRSSIDKEFIRSSKRTIPLDIASSQPPLKYRRRSVSLIRSP